MKNPPPSPPSYSRRDFLRRSAAASAFTILPSYRVRGQGTSEGELPPSERVNLAVVGIGNQGLGDRRAMVNSGLCRVVALCDVDLKGKHTQAAQDAHPDARRFTDFRVMFDKMADDIDAVLIATPDHAHFAITMLAMSLGKHVYVEKPLAHTFGQCQRLIQMARRSPRVVTQMGNQGHSGTNYFQFKAWHEAGVIRDVTRITAYMHGQRRWHGWGSTVTEFPSEPLPEGMDWDTWIGPSPEHPFSRRLHPAEWRSWFDFGSGAFGDWGPHILDTAHQFLDLGLPARIEALKREGPNPLVYPQASTIRFSFPARGEMPPCEVTWYDGVKNFPTIEPEFGDPVTDKESGKTIIRPIGHKNAGKLIYGKDLVFQGGSHSSALFVVPKERSEAVRDQLPRVSGKHSDHYTNFLLACKNEEESRSPFSISGPLTQMFNLGIIAQRLGGTLEFDRAGKNITNRPQANALLDPAPRKGWEEFYRL